LLAHPYVAGIYLSTDGGASWGQVSDGLTQGQTEPIAGDEQFLFTGSPVGVFRAPNSGRPRWTLANSGQTSPLIFSLALNGNTLFAGGFGSGMNRTFNDGASWERKDLCSNFITALLAAHGIVSAAGSGCGVTRFLDNGATWEPFSLSGVWVIALASGGGALFAGTHEGEIFRSTDEGKTWQRASAVFSSPVVIG